MIIKTIIGLDYHGDRLCKNIVKYVIFQGISIYGNGNDFTVELTTNFSNDIIYRGDKDGANKLASSIIDKLNKGEIPEVNIA